MTARSPKPMCFVGRYGGLLLMGLMVQCSDRGPSQQPSETDSQATQDRSTQDRSTQDRSTQDRSTQDGSTQDGDSKPGNAVLAQSAKETADIHIAWIAGSDPKSLDRVFFRFTLENAGKPGKTLAQGSAWLSRKGKARFSLRRGDEATQLTFVDKSSVLRGPAKGPFAPAEEEEAQRMQELTIVLQSLLGWDLLGPKVRLSLNKDGRLESQASGIKEHPGRIVERDIGSKGRLKALVIASTAHALEGERTGLHGSLPQRIALPLAKQVMDLEAWLTKAEFKSGYLDPKEASKLSADLVMGEEQENSKPTLREFGPIWEVAIKDPRDWESRVRILTHDIIKPFSDAGLGPAGLPSLTSNGKMLIHVRRADGKAGRPKAPKGYRLEERGRRVSAVVYVNCRWVDAERNLRAKLEPYIQKLGLRSRGPLWMSPYIDWAHAQEGPGKNEKVKIRGEIRVR